MSALFTLPRKTVWKFLKILYYVPLLTVMDFCMNENDSQVVLQPITVDDFNVICRVCLQIGENMTDIFKSGIENQFMEVTNLKMEVDDQLPRTLCQKCYSRMCQYCLFLRLAKSTDTFLRSLLPNVSDPKELDSKPARDSVSKEKKYIRKKRKKLVTQSQEVKTDMESDKVYLIFVPEPGGGKTEMDNKIFIKDLNLDGDNLELSNYCKTVVRSHFSDHTYPKEQEGPDDVDIRTSKPNNFADLRNQANKTYTVNLHIYNCGDCEATYEELNDMTAHLSTHEVEPAFFRSHFICPVCNFSNKEKDIFLSHLRTHKEEGFSFVKFNAESEIMSLKENEEDLFTESFPKKSEDCRIFRLNPNSLSCAVCSQTIQSIESIPDHLESCLCGVNTTIKFNIKYTCPICCETFFDEEKNFIKHLSSHKEENCFFIKVSSTGELVEVAEDEELFVSFEEASKIFDEKSRIFEIINRNSCGKCDYTLEYFNDLCEHSCDSKDNNIMTCISFNCPVCMNEFKKLDEFYEHLAEHKNEGISFILVKENGTLCEFDQKYSGIFTQSEFLLSVIRSPAVVFQNISPELVIWDLENSLGKYTCDFCQKEFKSKRKISLHMKSHGAKERLLDSVNYICERCGKKFSRKANYKKHFLKHLRVLSSILKRPVCTICNKKFANRATYDSHIRYHLKETNENECHTSLPGIICDKCGRSFSNNASLTRHKKMHLKEKENTLFKCEICHRDFFNQSSFDRHKSAHLNPKYYECGTCKFPLPTVTSLQKHLQTHKTGSKTFDCKDCQLSFLTKDSLNAHQSHTGHYVDKKPFECNVCHEKFFIGKKFSEHIKTHPKYKVGECTLCGKRLSTSDSLMKHRRRHFESNTVLCPHCGKRFFEDKNYERHLMIHEGIKPFPCDLEGCEKAFYTGFELRRHKKYHSNERDFKCSYCPKSFTEASHLTTHIRTHTGERPYRCPHCNKGFQTRSHCKNHIKLIHQGVGYDLIRTNISKKVAVFEGVEQND